MPGLSRCHRLCCLLTFCFCVGFSASSAASSTSGVSEEAPTTSLTLSLVEGGNWQLASRPSKAVLIAFWGIWCEPCRAAMPTLQALQQRFASEGVEIVLANTDGAEFLERVASIVAKEGSAMTATIDEEGAACARYSGAHATPFYILLRPSGEELWRGSSLAGEQGVRLIRALQSVLR